MKDLNSNAAISISNLCKTYKDFEVLKDLSFSVNAGEIFGLLGPNGAGKTTAINLAIGLYKKDLGEISILGLDPSIHKKKVRKLIGLVPQDTNLYEDLSASENLWHHAALYCDDLTKARAGIEELLKLMELWGRHKEPVRNYSGGMKRRLALARALLHDPSIIFFDEPTLGVDVQGKHVLWNHVKNLGKLGKTVVVTTNDMAEADILTDRIGILDRGALVALDTPENLKASLRKDIVTLNTDSTVEDPENFFSGLNVSSITKYEGNCLRLEVTDGQKAGPELINRLSTKYQISSFQIARPTLDDVFLHLTGKGLREGGIS